MRFIKNILILFSLLFILPLQGQTDTEHKVLFVGNSYTYFWNLPQCVSSMSEVGKVTLTARQSTAGGANLGQHWSGQKDLKTRSKIENGKFDMVVLQDHSMRAIDGLDSLLYYGELFSDLIRKENGQVYLYMTWAREWDPYMQNKITEGYSELAERTNAKIVPVGPAWERASILRPDIKLYDPDGSHPSPSGTYLSACVFYGVLTGQSPIGLPHRLTGTDRNGEKLYLNIQSTQNALFLQKVAEEIIRMFK